MTGSHPSVTLQFRTARDSDLATLLGLTREYYAFDHLPYDEAAAGNALQALLRDPSLGQAWLICEEEEVLGYTILTLGYSIEYRGRDAFIDELYLRENHRGRGLGRQALEFLEETAHRLGVRALHLEVERANTVAQQLYLGRGYRNNDRQLLTKILEP